MSRRKSQDFGKAEAASVRRHGARTMLPKVCQVRPLVVLELRVMLLKGSGFLEDVPVPTLL